MSVAQVFEKWVAHLRRLGLRSGGMLSPGLDEAFVRCAFEELGLECPEELIELYGRSGGLEAPDGAMLSDLWMFGSHFLLPFREAMENYESLRDLSGWNPTWFPFLGNDAGDFHAVDCRPGTAEVVYMMLGSGEPPRTRHGSIQDMLTVVVECFDRDICSVDDDGVLATDLTRAHLLAEEHRTRRSLDQRQ